ncbi:hypothetical protein J0H58_08480 [bacterium]|nr:hypothetical protein [bacterium]
MSALRLSVAFAFVSALVVLGCGSSDPKRHAVSGTVTYKTVPISNGTITFIPDDPAVKSSGGAAVKDGKFEIAAAAGLFPGKYKVSINYPDPKRTPPAPKEGEAPGESGREVMDLLPAKYNRDTELRAEVKADGSNALTFDLK